MFIEPSEYFTRTAKSVRRPPTERKVRCEQAECQRCMLQLDGSDDVTATCNFRSEEGRYECYRVQSNVT